MLSQELDMHSKASIRQILYTGSHLCYTHPNRPVFYILPAHFPLPPPGILVRQLEQFCGQWETWKAAVAAVAELDVLCSFALAADSYTDGAVCVPEVRACAEGQAPSLHASGLRHPCAPAGMGHGGFVPNDTTLGNDKAPFLLLTGPNMGGKSTLLRQVRGLFVMEDLGVYLVVAICWYGRMQYSGASCAARCALTVVRDPYQYDEEEHTYRFS